MSNDLSDVESNLHQHLDVTVYSDQDELITEVTSQVLQEIFLGLSRKKRFDLSLSGGSLGTAISRRLLAEWNENLEDYTGLHIWWSDERYVAADSEDRNANPLHEKMINKNIVIHEVLASDQSQSPQAAADNYLELLKFCEMDLILLGVGPDGHVASLFPHLLQPKDMNKIIVIDNSPKPPLVRISFTLEMINSASQVWIIAAGESKSEAVTKILEADPMIPASHVAAKAHTRLIVDTEAFLSE